MKDFPKKYNYHIVEKEIQDKNKKYKDYKIKNLAQIFSDLTPISDQLNLWDIFSLVYQDILSKNLNILWNNFYRNIWFYTSPSFKKITWTNQEKISHKILFNKQKHNQKQIYQSWIPHTKIPISTINEDYVHMARKIFIDLYKKWLIYEDKKIVYWSNEYQSVIWNDDVQFKTIHGKKYNIRYFIETKNDSIVISTTSPETIFSDVALLVNPNDKRYKKFVWSNVLIPIINKPIPILTDETVDTMQNNGIVRVNPNHDFIWLELAQKHKLQIDIWAIDDKWCFTQMTWIFAEKKVEDFFDNIIQYLDDISNLDRVFDFDYQIPVFKKTWEKLITILKKQRFIKILPENKESIIQSINNQEINVMPVEYIDQIRDGINHTDLWCISRQYSFGQSLPVRENTRWRTYIFDEWDVIDKLIKSRKSRKVMLTLIIFNLILDWYLSIDFSIDELVGILFSNTFQSDIRIIDYYIQNLQDKLSTNSKAKKYLSELKELKKVTEIIDMARKSSFEKIQLLLDILKKSYLIDNNWEDYKFNLSELCEDRYKISLQNCVFDPSFICSLWSIYVSWIYQDTPKKITKWILSTWSDNIDWIVKILIMNWSFSKELLFDRILIHPLLLNDKWNKLSHIDNIVFDSKDIFKNYGKDSLRLSFIINGKESDFQYCVDDIQLSSRFLDKLWNASRFIFKNFFSSRRKLNILNLKKEIEKNVDKLHETDIWIIYTFKTLLDELSSSISQWQIISFGNKSINIIRKYFCDRYLEIIKENKTAYTPSVVLYHLIMILKLIYPYAPYISQKIVDNFWWDINEIQMDMFSLNTDKIHKNYKIHLFFDIMDKIVEIREKNCLKQHESIDIFLQANTDFIELIEDYEELLKRLLKINDIEYLRPHQTIPNGYILDTVINITLWVKTKKFCSEKDIVSWLRSQLEEKEHHIQNLRSILSSSSVSENKEEKDKKEKEMKKLKKEVLELEYKINKIKMNK